MGLKSVLKSWVPAVGRDNEGCRERWLKAKLLEIPADSRILDAGAGTQRYRDFCQHLDYVSQDFGQYDGKGDGAGGQTGEFDYGNLDIVSDITSIPEPDASFDALMCIEVLEHVPDPIAAVQEFGRLLKPGGRLMVTAPFCSLTHFSPYHFSSGFNKYWYERHLADSGFEILEIESNGNFFEYVAQEMYRVPGVSIRYSESKPNPLELFSMFIVQRMLLRFSRKDTGSSELLCYGYHVCARKVGDPPPGPRRN